VGHDQAERLISERLDGVRLAPRPRLALETHLATCDACRRFEHDAYAVRERLRFEVAPEVPDVTDQVMAAIAREMRERRPRRRRPRVLAPALASLVVGALVGSLLVGGPFDRAERDARALAADVSRAIARTASSIEAYEATYAIVERHLAPDVARRDLEMHVWFRAPERFRLDVSDLTAYPDPATPSDLRLIVDGSSWYLAAPEACETSVCGEREVLVTNRTPFSSSAPAPTDLVLPLTALGDPQGMRVLGRSRVLGHDAVEVEVPFRRAAPLFPFLSLGGRWRPFFADDVVRVWLDAHAWFPLRWQVFPSADAAREAWALRYGLPPEPPGRPIFDVRATSVAMEAPPASVFAVPEAAPEQRDQGSHVVAPATLAARTGFTPVVPAARAGLEEYRAVVPRGGARALITYVDGLSYLKVAQSRTWSGDAPFGPVDAAAERVALADGVGYFEPADGSHGRRLAIHADGVDLYLETNLPRSTLLEVGSSLPVRGLALPARWRVSRAQGSVTRLVSIDRARSVTGLPVAVPSSLPPGLALASVELTRVARTTGVTVTFRATQDALAVPPVRLHLEAAGQLPPASSSHQRVVALGDAAARWTPDRSLLEWVTGGVYRSLDGPGLTLAAAVAIARSIPGGGA
jgi:hypothetical protein